MRVVESYRSPERQAFLLVQGGGLTFTAMSKHSAGRAVDVIVGDGDLKILEPAPGGSPSGSG